MAGEMNARGSQLNFSIDMLFKSVQICIERLQPSTCNQQLSSCITDQSDDQNTHDANVATKVFPKPPCPLGVLLIILLENSTSKAHTFDELKDMLCELFPYFKTVILDDIILREMMSHIMCMEEYQSVFIKEKRKGSEIICVHLNPLKRKVYVKIVQEYLQNHEEELKNSMCKPDLLNKFLHGRESLRCYSMHYLKDLSNKVHTSGIVGGESLPEINGQSERTSIRKSESNEKSSTGNNFVNDIPEESERKKCEAPGPDCQQLVQEGSKSSGIVKSSVSSSKVDALESTVDSVTGETVCPNNRSLSQQVLSLGETSLTMQPQLETVQKNLLENVKAVESPISGVNISVELISRTVQKTSLENLETVGDSVSSVNVSEKLMFGTVKKDSNKNFKTVEDSVSNVNISEKQLPGTVKTNSKKILQSVEDSLSSVSISEEQMPGTVQKKSLENLASVESSVSSVNIREEQTSERAPKNSLKNLEAAEDSISSVNINEMSGKLQKNSSENLKAVENLVSSVNVIVGQMSGTVQKNSLVRLEAFEDTDSSVNTNEKQMSETVPRKSLESLKPVEDLVSSVNMSEEQMLGTIQKNSSENFKAVKDTDLSVIIKEELMSERTLKNSSENLKAVEDSISTVNINEQMSQIVPKKSFVSLEPVEDLISSVNIRDQQMLETVHKNSSETLKAVVEDSVSSVSINEKQMSGTLQKNSSESLKVVENLVSSVNIIEEQILGTVQKNSLENLEAVEDPVSCVASLQSVENIGNLVELRNENESQGIKRKQIIHCKVQKKRKVSPSKVSQTELQNGVVILEKERNYASQEESNNSSEKSLSLYSKQGSSGGEKFQNKDSLPMNAGTVSLSVSDINDKDDNMVHLEHRDVGMPVMEDVIVIGSKECTQQREAAGVSERSSSKFRNCGLPVIVSVANKAFHIWTPEKSSSPSEGGKRLQVLGKKVEQYENHGRKEHLGICKKRIVDEDSQVNSHNVIQGASTHSAPPINNSNKTRAGGQFVQFVENVHSKNGAINTTLTASLSPMNSICSESPNHTVSSSSASLNRQLATGLPFSVVSSCIDAWQNLYPWMLYHDSDQSFLCKTCEWGNALNKSCVVLTLNDSSNVFSTANQLHFHQEALSHKLISRKKDIVHIFFKLLYPVVKHYKFRSFDSIIEDITLLSGGYFPWPHDALKKEYYIFNMIKRIAECVEFNLLKSLAKSPVFSIVAVQRQEFAILRWLNHKGESEEHFFSSRLCCSGKVMPILTYLQEKKVDKTKLTSYINFPNSNMREAYTGLLPIRYPPLSECIKWLEKTDFLQDLFVQLENLVTVCKSFFEKFAAFSAAFEMVNVEIPYSFSCVVNENILDFYFSNFSELKKICFEIYNETKSNNALNFSRAELTCFKSVQDFVSLLPILHRLFTEENGDYSVLSRVIEKFRSSVCTKRRALKGRNSDESIAFSVLEQYLSHTVISLQSQEQSIADIFTLELRKITTKDLQKFLSKLKLDYEGGGIQLLQDLHKLRLQLSKSRDCFIVKLLEDLTKKPEICQAFPHLFSLYQKITVLPFIDANREQYMFNVAILDMFLNGKFRDDLISPISFIVLEGPPIAEIDVDYLMDLWSKNSKLDYTSR